MSVPEEYQAACVQFDVTAGDVDANVAAMQTGVDEAMSAGARLCVLPELWSTSFDEAIDAATVARALDAEEAVREASERHGALLVGSAIEQDGDAVFNTATVYQGGKVLGRYRKMHLFSPNLEHRHHQRGSEPLVLDTDLGRIGVLICYDLRFPELSRYYFHRGVELLLVPGQWPEARGQHWRTLLRARAIENQCFVVGCNRTGQSPSLRSGEAMSFPGDGRIVDPTGEVLANGNGDAGAVVAPIELRKVRTMRRILPIELDERPEIYRRLLEEVYPSMLERTRARTNPEPAE